MSDGPRVVQPMVVMQPPPEPLIDPDGGEQFVEDTRVQGDLTYTEWLAQHRPLPSAPRGHVEYEDAIPEL